MTESGKLAAGLILAAIGGIGFVATGFLARTPPAVAPRPGAPAGGQVIPSGSSGAPGPQMIPGTRAKREVYLWRTNRELLYLRQTSADVYFPTLVDIGTGGEVRLPPLPSNATQNVPWETWRLSPNGEWLLWAGGTRHRTWAAARLDGSRHLQWTGMSHRSTGGWLRDGQRWVEVDEVRGRARFLIRSILNPDEVEIFDLPHLRFSGNLLGIGKNGEMLLYTDGDPCDDTFDLITINRRSSPPAVRRVAVRCPPKAEVAGMALSPQGDGIAWNLWYRLGRPDRPDPRYRVSVRVSRLDGSQMREACSITGSAAERGGPPHLTPAAVIAWSPDGTGIAFSNRNALWVVDRPR